MNDDQSLHGMSIHRKVRNCTILTLAIWVKPSHPLLAPGVLQGVLHRLRAMRQLLHQAL